MFGTSVFLENKTEKTQDLVLENVDFNPLQNHKSSLSDGYLFRSPNVNPDNWYDILSSLPNLEDSYNLWAVKQDKIVNCFVRIQNQSDAAVFAFANTENWQKWDKEKEEEYKAEQKAKKKKPALKVNKDGSVTVRVTVETLDKP